MKPRIVAFRAVNNVESLVSAVSEMMREESENLPFGKELTQTSTKFVDEKNNPISQIELVEYMGTYRVRLIS